MRRAEGENKIVSEGTALEQAVGGDETGHPGLFLGITWED